MRSVLNFVRVPILLLPLPAEIVKPTPLLEVRRNQKISPAKRSLETHPSPPLESRAPQVEMTGDAVFLRASSARESVYPTREHVSFYTDALTINQVAGVTAMLTALTVRTAFIYREFLEDELPRIREEYPPPKQEAAASSEESDQRVSKP